MQRYWIVLRWLFVENRNQEVYKFNPRATYDDGLDFSIKQVLLQKEAQDFYIQYMYKLYIY